MSARDKDARAAMDTILCNSLSGEVDALSPVEVAHDAWLYADAMEAERKRRDQVDATAPEIREPLPGDEHVGAGASPSRSMRRDAEPQLTAAQVMELGRRVGKEELAAACENARREGRDAGLAEAIQVVARRRHHSDFPRDGRTLQDAWEAISEQLDKAPAPDALASETAKLRAVAEAAARLQRWRGDDRGSDTDGWEASIALSRALDAALPGWKTK